MSKELSNCKFANGDDSQFVFFLKLKQLLLVICLPALLLACGQKGALYLNQELKQELKQEVNQELNQGLDQAPLDAQLESLKIEDDKLKKPIN